MMDGDGIRKLELTYIMYVTLAVVDKIHPCLFFTGRESDQARELKNNGHWTLIRSSVAAKNSYSSKDALVGSSALA